MRHQPKRKNHVPEIPASTGKTLRTTGIRLAVTRQEEVVCGIMPTVSLALAHASYDVHVENGILDRCGELMTRAGISGRIAVITDTNVGPHYEERVMKSLTDAGFEAFCLTIPAGEASKSLSQVETLCDELARRGIDRQGTLVALGGGVIGDLTGFVAAIHYRGIPFVQIPTTIVSQVDSSVGGKTGVNLPSGKNLVGAFHHPKLVVADPSTLITLPRRVMIEGLGEVVKHAAIRDAEMLPLLEELAPHLKKGINEKTLALLPELIARNVAIKARVVEADEKETTGLRALLNFGHTLGHGIEASVPYGSLLHGECVSLGIRSALLLSVRYGGLPETDARRLLALMQALELPLNLPASVDVEKALLKASADKKFEAGSIRFVLLDKLGSAFVSKDITSQDMKDALVELTQPWE